jgi:acetoin utilization deacetylase AcuC-like enzyme
MFAGGGVWFDGQAFHVPGAEPTHREIQPFVNPTYDKTAAPKLPPQPRRARGTYKRPARPWHAEASSRLPRPSKQKVEPLCPYHTEAPPRKMKHRKEKRRKAKEDEARAAQDAAEQERSRQAHMAEAEATLRTLFKAHAPELLVSVPTLMANWRGREWQMVARFKQRYELEEATRAVEEKAFNRPAPRLPRIGMPGKELGWLGDDRISSDGSRPTNRTMHQAVHLPRLGHPGRELGWLGVSMNDKPKDL